MDILELLKYLFIILLPTQSHGLTQLLQSVYKQGIDLMDVHELIIHEKFRGGYTSNQDLPIICLPCLLPCQNHTDCTPSS